MCVLARHGSRHNWLYQKMFDVQRQQQSADTETLHPHKVPQAPWVKIVMDFFQDDFSKKHLIVADYFSKFSYVYPVTSSHHLKTINYLQELFTMEGVPAIVMSNNGPPFNGDDFKKFSKDFDFVHISSSPHFHQSNGFIEAMVKKVKNATTERLMVSSTAQARALLQLCDTPIVTWTYHHQQKSFMADQPKVQYYRDTPNISIWSRSIRNWPRSNRTRKRTLTDPIEPKICKCSKWMRKWHFSQTNKGQVDSLGWWGQSTKY